MSAINNLRGMNNIQSRTNQYQKSIRNNRGDKKTTNQDIDADVNKSASEKDARLWNEYVLKNCNFKDSL